MNLRCWKKDVDYRPFSVAKGFPGSFDITDAGTGKPGNSDTMTLNFLRYLSHCFEVARRGGRKACFDNVYVEAHKLLGHLQLLLRGHSGSGRLFAITQRCIKNPNCGNSRWVCHDNLSSLVALTSKIWIPRFLSFYLGR